MILQLLLGGVGGFWLAFRLWKQRILHLLGIRKQEQVDQLPAEPGPATEDQQRRSLPT